MSGCNTLLDVFVELDEDDLEALKDVQEALASGAFSMRAVRRLMLNHARCPACGKRLTLEGYYPLSTALLDDNDWEGDQGDEPFVLTRVFCPGHVDVSVETRAPTPPMAWDQVLASRSDAILNQAERVAPFLCPQCGAPLRFYAQGSMTLAFRVLLEGVEEEPASEIESPLVVEALCPSCGWYVGGDAVGTGPDLLSAAENLLRQRLRKARDER